MRKVSREAVIAINNAFPDQKDFDLMKELEKIESGGVGKNLPRRRKSIFIEFFSC